MRGTHYERCGACGRKGAHFRSVWPKSKAWCAYTVECRYCGAGATTGKMESADEMRVTGREFRHHWPAIAAGLK